MKVLLALGLASLVLSGCASNGLAGIGGSSEYSCAAPPGVSCMSITGLNANADRKTLPAMRHRAEDERVDGKALEAKEAKAAEASYLAQRAPNTEGASVSPGAMDAPYSGTPLRTPPRVLRIWLAPFEDTDADLHDQKYVYVTIHTGRWVLEANQINIQPQFKHVFPLGRKEAEGQEDKAKSTGPAVDANGEPLAITGRGQ